MEEMRKYNKMNLIDLLLHLHKRTIMPTTTKKDKKKKTIRGCSSPTQTKALTS